MNIKIRRPRSCLGYLGWLILAVVVFVLLSNAYAKVRLHLARKQAMELALQLGYTSEGLLRERVDTANVNIVTGSAVCSVIFYFETPQELSDFESLLLAMQPGTRRINPGIDYLKEIYAELPLSRNGVSSWQPGARDKLPGIAAVSWYLPGGGAMQSNVVELYQTKQVEAKLTYGDRQVVDNIAIIDWTAGRFPIWVWC